VAQHGFLRHEMKAKIGHNNDTIQQQWEEGGIVGVTPSSFAFVSRISKCSIRSEQFCFYALLIVLFCFLFSFCSIYMLRYIGHRLKSAVNGIRFYDVMGLNLVAMQISIWPVMLPTSYNNHS
jgi:hypothetical protein